ncbi:competence/damage-inducible protein A [Aestuariicella hydrocarbonica]|uniref:Competence/damage-inducible protein A n=1 Tax=Pseudomaricurvus hydrocarbonicus TaxID=1470433 RepID=A0A9E5MIZ2_9GAMM|nr:molybdopterin-binding protein [Aestuariicella hydrocarbonica]NHO64254.1 competence/damage-inducible protein A [Aestuariicella hydrocarbonica]
MQIGLVIVGDEILSGRRTDKHLSKIVEILNQRGLCLNWARVLGDDMDELVECYQQSFAKGHLVLSTGGIGATPDDLTREAVARALGTVTQRHPDGVKLLEKFARETGRELTDTRYRLVEFPKGTTIIPNPVNGIPGFSIQDHHFVPGFPQMAWPMLEWVLDTQYPDIADRSYREHSVMLQGANESTIIPLMEQLLADFAGIKVFSLPIMGDEPRIELGVKGPQLLAKEAYTAMKQGLQALDIRWQRASD